METRNQVKKKIFEIFKEFMMGIAELEELGNAANSFLLRFQQALNETALAIETATKFSIQLDKDTSDEELRQATCDEENETVHFSQEHEVTEYATLIAVVYSMMKQNYVMQEKIVRSLSLKSSSGELETYSLMWSLRPFVEDEIVNRAWKWIY
ncbi:hypothetical protein CARUB_v10018811mg [Capsella rubella]|uniref:DUF7795 domain-containing protein n=1 Tax=Capsella rubella TaxID=81985 RepID=R0HNJ6_9BRAS|nr:hypothetical protein CARUB_v10018811mg [Capsella rubella]